MNNSSSNIVLPIYIKSTFGERIQPFIGAGISLGLFASGNESGTWHSTHVDITNQTLSYNEGESDEHTSKTLSYYTFQSGIVLPFKTTKLIAGLELRSAFSPIDYYAKYRPIILRGSVGFTF